jgi:hypothetical protein
MGCCGQRRDSLRTQPEAPVQRRPPPAISATAARPFADAPPRGTAPPSGTVLLRYGGRSALTVRGAVTGRIYAFAPVQPLQPVDERDVPALSAAGGFTVV